MNKLTTSAPLTLVLVILSLDWCGSDIGAKVEGRRNHFAVRTAEWFTFIGELDGVEYRSLRVVDHLGRAREIDERMVVSVGAHRVVEDLVGNAVLDDAR